MKNLRIDGNTENEILLDEFEKYLYSEQKSENTIHDYRAFCERFLKWSGKHWSKLNMSEVQRWKADNRDRGLSNKTIVTHTAILKGLLRFVSISLEGEATRELEDKFIRLENKITAGVPAKARPYDWLKFREGQKLLKRTGYLNSGIREWNWRIAVRLMMCGLRKTEILTLRDCDVDLEIGRIRIRPEVAKHQHARDIYPGRYFDWILPDLIEYRALNPPENPEDTFLRQSTKDDDGNMVHKPLKDTTLYAITNRVTKRNIGRRVKCHALRHWCATMMTFVGVPPDTIRIYMGHTNQDDTTRYTHTDIWQGEYDAYVQEGNDDMVELMDRTRNTYIAQNGNGYANGNGHTNGNGHAPLSKTELLQALDNIFYQERGMTYSEYVAERERILKG